MSVYDRNYQKQGLSPLHQKILRWLPQKVVVLDVGCAAGYLAKEIKKKKKSVVYGIEYDAESGQKARRVFEKVWIGSVEDNKLFKKIPIKKFDFLILADILEYLRNPEIFLQYSKKWLKKNGKVLVSIPNIANFESQERNYFGSI